MQNADVDEQRKLLVIILTATLAALAVHRLAEWGQAHALEIRLPVRTLSYDGLD